MTPQLVRDLLPEVYADIETLIQAEGMSSLRQGLESLAVTETCGCGDDFCASFYTGARPRGGWSDEGSHLTLVDGDTIVVESIDVVDSTIRYVEIISAKSEAGQRVVNALKSIGAEPQ